MILVIMMNLVVLSKPNDSGDFKEYIMVNFMNLLILVYHIILVNLAILVNLVILVILVIRVTLVVLRNLMILILL